MGCLYIMMLCLLLRQQLGKVVELQRQLLVFFYLGRKFTLIGKISSELFPCAVLRSELQADGALVLYQHSGCGLGTSIHPDLTEIKIHIIIINLICLDWLFRLEYKGEETLTND